jgi:uncharacterized membrane protein YkvA (DUF1232 family)
MFRLFRFWRLAGLDLRLLWFALQQPGRPAWLLPAVSALLFYAIEPLNFAVPLLGIVDDVVLFPLLVHWLARVLPAHIQSDFRRARVSRR